MRTGVLPGAALLLLLATIPVVLYIRTLYGALQRCSLHTRTLKPALVWLLLIPVVSLAWHFVVVSRIASSLHNEFTRRDIPGMEPRPGRTLGLATSILGLLSFFPRLRLVLLVPAFFCWVAYWAKIGSYSRLLSPPTAPASSFAGVRGAF